MDEKDLIAKSQEGNEEGEEWPAEKILPWERIGAEGRHDHVYQCAEAGVDNSIQVGPPDIGIFKNGLFMLY